MNKEIKNGKYIKTIYGRKWKSYEQENKENFIIVICGLIFVVILLLFN